MPFSYESTGSTGVWTTAQRATGIAGLDRTSGLRCRQGAALDGGPCGTRRVRSAPPDKLARLATALGFSPAELFAAAGYVRADELARLRDLFESKYPSLAQSEVDELRQRSHELAPGPVTEALEVEVEDDASRQWPMIYLFSKGGARMIRTPYSSVMKSGEVNPFFDQKCSVQPQ